MALRPRAAEHYEQAQAFDEFYSHLGGTASAWPQWVAVVLFYTAVHEVQAFLVARQVYTYDHVTRRQALDARWRPLAASTERSLT